MLSRRTPITKNQKTKSNDKRIPKQQPNNNPGNIRLDGVHWKGEKEPSTDKEFKQFETMAWGYRAMFQCLNTYYSKHGLDTIRKMISRWAPETENATENYIKAVSDRCPTAGSRRRTAT